MSLGQVPDYAKPTGLTGGFLTAKVREPYTDSSNHTTLSDYKANVQISGSVFRFIDQLTAARLTLPVQGTGDPTGTLVDIVEVLEFSNGDKSRNFYTRYLRETAPGVFDYRQPQDANYSQNYPPSLQQAAALVADLEVLVERGETVLEAVTDVTVTAEDEESVTLEFDDDPLASAAIGTAITELQTLVDALDDRADDLEAAVTGLDGRMDATETTIATFDPRLDALETDISALEGDLDAQIMLGEIRMYVTATPPAGWMVCDGLAISRTTYAGLFALIGTTYGAGDSATTFNLPDLRGRFPLGAGTGSGLTTRNIAATGGAETHTLTTSEMPAHDHAVNLALFGEAGQENKVANGAGSQETSFSGTTGSAGGGAAHNNMPPYLVLQFIIRVQ